jgi:hypothetical protein
MNKIKIICIKPCENHQEYKGWNNSQIEKGQIFTTNDVDFYDLNRYLYLYSDQKFLGLFDKSNFIRLDEYRNNIIYELTNN